MEIRVYRSLQFRAEGKTLFCSRVACPDAFSFTGCVNTFRSIYGSDCVIEFLIV